MTVDQMQILDIKPYLTVEEAGSLYGNWRAYDKGNDF